MKKEIGNENMEKTRSATETAQRGIFYNTVSVPRATPPKRLKRSRQGVKYDLGLKKRKKTNKKTQRKSDHYITWQRRRSSAMDGIRRKETTENSEEDLRQRRREAMGKGSQKSQNKTERTKSEKGKKKRNGGIIRSASARPGKHHRTTESKIKNLTKRSGG